MKERILVAAVFVPLLLIVMLFLPEIWFDLLIAVISGISAYEFVHAIGADRNIRIPVYAVAAAVILALRHYVRQLPFGVVLFLLTLVLFFEAVLAFRTEKELKLAHVLGTVFAGAVIPFFLSELTALNRMGNIYVVIPFIIAFLTDAGAYFVGVSVGRRKAFPNVSPKKTVEGCIGGIFTGVAAMAVYGVVLVFALDMTPHFLTLILLGFVGAVVTEMGDLAFSMIKREYDIKDFGHLLPGHGGMLDRFDSMIFCAPATALLLSRLPLLV